MPTACEQLVTALRNWTPENGPSPQLLMAQAATLLEEAVADQAKWRRFALQCQDEHARSARENARHRRRPYIKSAPLLRNLADANMDELVKLHNDARARSGWFKPLRALQPHAELMQYAQTHAITMAAGGWLKHSSMRNVLKLGFSRAGENIAWGQNDARTVMDSWLWSPFHRFNILSAAYTHVGCGARKDCDGRLYWCAVFGALQPTVAP